MSEGVVRTSGSPRRRLRGPAYGLLAGPFVGGVTVTLLIAAGARQPLNLGWVLGAFLVGATVATLAFASTLWRHEPHVVAGARARASPAAPISDAAPPEAASAPVFLAMSVGGAGPGDLPLERERPDDPLAHIHAVEDQGRRLRRDCVNCGTPVSLEAAACPSCGQPQVYTCKGCKTPIRLEWTQCPECGREVH